MRHSALGRAVALAAVLGLAVLGAAPAFGSGFQLIEQNGSGLGNAYSGQAASVKDASAVFFNPANMTRVEGTQVAVSLEYIGVGTKFTDSGSTRPFLPTNPPTPISAQLGGTGGDAGGWTPVPNAYFTWQAGKSLWLGLGLNAPFGLKTEWDPTWMGRFHATKSEVKTYNINPSVAFKVNENYSLGAGVSYQKLDATLASAVPYGGLAVGAAAPYGAAAQAGILAQLGGLSGLAREGEATIEGDTWTWGYNFGLHAKLGQYGHLGATYRSKIKHELDGTVTFANAPTFATSGPLGALGTGINARFANGPATTTVELPETFSIAASYETDKYELMADYTYTGWDSIQALVITRPDGTQVSSVPLNFETTWRTGLGFNYQVNDKFKLRLGLAYDKAPVQDEYRTPRLPDNDRVWTAAGFEYKLGEKGAFDMGYAHLFVSDASSNLPNQDTPASPPKGKLIGSYAAKVDILSAQFRFSF